MTTEKIIKPTSIVVASHTEMILTLGQSPLGVSFRENACSSYLRGTVPLSPPTNLQCPRLNEYPGWSSLDVSCKLLIDTLPRCSVISPEHIGEVASACNYFLRTAPTYSGCVDSIGSSSLPIWRVFLDAHENFVHNNGGEITLLDERGRIIDIFPYQTIGLQ